MDIRRKPILLLALAILALATGFLAERLSHYRPAARPPVPPVVAAPAKDGPILAPQDGVHAQYAGSASCRECHEAAYKGWLDSNHGLAERGFP